MKKLIILVLVIAAAVWWLRTPRIEAPSAKISFDYIVKYSGEADSAASLPMLVALHGNGDTPQHFFETALDLITIPARIILIKAPVNMGHGTAWPMDGETLAQYANALSEVVPLLLVKYPTKKQPVLLGFSGGGVMAYYLSAAHPQLFSFIFPVSGRLRQQNLNGIQSMHNRNTRIFAFHGLQDSVIDISGGRMAHQLLQARGAQISFQEFQGGHLGVFTSMKPEINRLLDQKLKLLLYGV